VEFDEDARVLFGEVEGLRDVVTFEATDVKDLEREFRASVDDYLAMCAERGEEPEKPYSGKFLVRVDPMLHREVTMAAARAGKSLNAPGGVFDWIERASPTHAPRPMPAPNVNQPAKGVTVFPPAGAPVEVPAMHEQSLEFWHQHQNTPGSRTPNTPGASRTPQQDIPKKKVA
jgi:predicted HicB family RNase H-like nuclease